MTVSIHSRAYRLLQGAPVINGTPDEKKQTHSRGQCPLRENDRTFSKDSNSYCQRSISPLSVTEIHEELSACGDNSTFLNKPQRPTLLKSCVASKKKAQKPLRRVRFPTSPVSQVKTRPRTLPEDVRRLFYSSGEMSMFRRNYYAYMNSRRTEEVDYYEEETISVQSTNNSRPILNLASSQNEDNPWQIVKAIVSHQGETREYYHQSHCTSQINVGTSNSCSFDNPEFWNGTITWF